MKKQPFMLVILAISIAAITTSGISAHAGEPESRSQSSILLTGWSKHTSVDLSPYSGDQCHPVGAGCPECIERVPVQECVTGKKTVYDCNIRYEYVSIPEVRYRWKNIWVTREIPADYSQPVCKKEDGQQSYGQERWDKQGDGKCSTLHCRTIESKLEKADCKYCDSKPGKTTIKVRYKTCVKVPYTVYRRVRRPICVKQPRYEKVEVLITKHECRKLACKSCDGAGCKSCIDR